MAAAICSIPDAIELLSEGGDATKILVHNSDPLYH